MKKVLVALVATLLQIQVTFCQNKQGDFLVLKGKYLDKNHRLTALSYLLPDISQRIQPSGH